VQYKLQVYSHAAQVSATSALTAGASSSAFQTSLASKAGLTGVTGVTVTVAPATETIQTTATHTDAAPITDDNWNWIAGIVGGLLFFGVLLCFCLFTTTKAELPYKCGSRMIWLLAFFLFALAGVVCVYSAVMIGACSCNSFDGGQGCALGGTSGGAGGYTCTSYMKGCENGYGEYYGEYDQRKCQDEYNKHINPTTRRTISCMFDSCKYGGMLVETWAACLLGGLLCLILAVIFICGVFPCCCFKIPDDPIGAVVAGIPDPDNTLPKHMMVHTSAAPRACDQLDPPQFTPQANHMAMHAYVDQQQLGAGHDEAEGRMCC